MEAGKVSIQYKKLYGYRKGEDGQPEIIPEQAEIVRWLYERYRTAVSYTHLMQANPVRRTGFP